MSEDTYLKDNIKKCVDYVMNKNDDDKRRIITGMFQYNDYLLNEQLLIKALKDEEKQEWFNNDMFDTYKLEIERLHSIIKEVREHIEKTIEYEKSCGFNRWTYEDGQETYIDMVEKTLEILDKENK